MKPLSVLIVDDDAMMRISLKSLIAWQEHGYRLIGEASDGEQALEWLERSAAQGYHEAQFLLGVYHLHGGMDGVEEDEAEGLRLLELAVEQHDHDAEYFLGMHLLNLPGEGTDGGKAWLSAAPGGGAERRGKGGV